MGSSSVVSYIMYAVLEQVAQVKVKTYQNGLLTNLFYSSTDPICEIYRIKSKYGFSGIPITENGKMGSRLRNGIF